MIANFPHATNTDDVVDTLKAMRKQEEKAYQCGDYLSMYQSDPPSNASHGPQQPAADADCRYKMSEWCYQVVDFCKFNRETVEISMNILDRFLMTPKGQCVLSDRKVFQLAAMTCLYSAIKVFEPEAMEPSIISNLSRGAYTVDDVEEMERNILSSLGFRVNVPTAMAFAHHFLALLPADAISAEDQTAIIELVKLQVEKSVNHYEFVSFNASTIAHAAMANAFHCVYDMDECMESDFLQIISNIAKINNETDNYTCVLEKLFGILVNSPLGGTMATTTAPKKTTPSTVTKAIASGSVHSSPRSVATCQA